MKTKKSFFGALSDGTSVSLYTVTNGDFSFSACNLGCIITNITMNDKYGIPGDIVLGFSTLDGYINSTGTSFGALIGRYANRIGGASFELNGKKYCLDANDGANCLHSGYNTFEKKMWNARFVQTAY